MSTITATPSRTVNRGANPFSAFIKQQNQALAPKQSSSIYEDLQTRGDRVYKDDRVQKAIADLKARLNGQIYSQKDFGELVLVPYKLIDININIQRDEDAKHIADDIIVRFDPRLCMPVMCTRLVNGRYSAWEGQQTSLTFYVLHKAGIINEDTLIQVKAYDENLTVPGTTLVGEAVGNMGFRVINGGGRKAIDAYHLHRSRVSGVRLYNSAFREDMQSEEIQQIVEKNNMFTAKTSAAANNKAAPGMITYIHGLNLIANHDSDKKLFDLAKLDLDWALSWHNTYYPNEKGVDGGFILAFGRLAESARQQKIKLDRATEQDLYRLFRSRYASPKGFHKDCKERLKKFQHNNNLPESWTDSCLTPILVMDYINFGGTCALPQVPHMTTFAGI